MSSARRSTPASWLRERESASLRSRNAEQDAASQRWDALDDPAQRMALVREIVATRAAELTLAYRNVVAVVAGFRAQRNAVGDEELHPQPCVIFMVRQKWAAGQVADAAQRLPSRLLAYGPCLGRSRAVVRCLYAVPTDVQPALRHMGARARASATVRVADEVAQFALPGTLTCGVRLRGAPAGQARFAMSAMHVLSPVPRQLLARGGATFTALGASADSAPLGSTTEWGGHIDADLGTAFDAQLAAVNDRAWFNTAFAPLKLSARRAFVAGPDLLDALAPTTAFQIVVQDNQPNAPPGPRGLVQAQFSKYMGPEWRVIYDVRQGSKATPVAVAHAQLLLLVVSADSAAPVSGDSGSPVVCRAPDGDLTLLGMYIASGPAGAERDAYVLPAWELFNPDNWSSLPAGTLALKPSFTVP